MELEFWLPGDTFPRELNRVAEIATGMWLMNERLYERVRRISETVSNLRVSQWQCGDEFLTTVFTFPVIPVSTPALDLHSMRISRAASDVDVIIAWEVRDFEANLLGGKKLQTSGNLWMTMNHEGIFAKESTVMMHAARVPGEKPGEVFVNLPVVYNNKTDGARLRAQVKSRVLGRKLLKLQDLLECIKEIELYLHLPHLPHLPLHETNHPRSNTRSRSGVRKNSKAVNSQP